jgi:hypothetical protein
MFDTVLVATVAARASSRQVKPPLRTRIAIALLAALAINAEAAGGAPILVSPGNDAANVGRSPTLAVTMAGQETNRITVTFYGRVRNPNLDFSIVALPDTQFYSSGGKGGDPAIFTTQTEWILAQHHASNIVYVAQEGDITDDGGSEAQWLNATNALYRLENCAATGLSDGIAARCRGIKAWSRPRRGPAMRNGHRNWTWASSTRNQFAASQLILPPLRILEPNRRNSASAVSHAKIQVFLRTAGLSLPENSCHSPHPRST